MDNPYIAREKRKKAVEIIWIDNDAERWAQAVELLREAIALGDLQAYYYLGRCFVWHDAGLGSIDSAREGERLFQEGAGLGGALCVLGLLRMRKVDGKSGFPLRDAFAEVVDMALDGDPYANYVIGSAYLCDDVSFLTEMPESMGAADRHAVWRRESRRWFLRAGRLGVTNALDNLANVCVEEGLYSEAASLALMAADCGDTMGCLIYAIRCLTGEGAPQDTALALTYLEKGAARRSARCALQLASVYYFGKYGLKEDNAKAYQYFTMALDLGSCDAWHYLGEIHHYGHGVPVDAAKAAEYYEKSLDSGCENAKLSAYGMGRLYYSGIHGQLEEDNGKARDYFRLAARFGVGNAWYYLGEIYARGLGVGKDMGQAVSCYEKAIARGCSAAALELGRIYYFGRGVGEDMEAALRYFTQAADLGSHIACYFLGEIYHKAFGVQEDLARAVEYYRMAAEHDDGSSYYELGKIYYFGRDGEEDNSAARLCFEQAAAKGKGAAWYYLGEIYHNGYGVPINEEKAVRCYGKLPADADSGMLGDAAYKLGMIYYTGSGDVPRDLKKARQLFEESTRYPGTKNAERQSLYCLGRMYETGEGVVINYTKASGYYSKSARLGSPEAAEALPGCLSKAIASGGDDEDPDKRHGLTDWKKHGKR